MEAVAHLQLLLLGDNRLPSSEQTATVTSKQFAMQRRLASLVDPFTPTFLLRAYRLCSPCRLTILPELFESLGHLFPSVSSSIAFSRRCATLVQLYTETEKALLGVIAHRAGADLGARLAPPADTGSAPGKPSPFVPEWRAALNHFQKELESVLPTSSASKGRNAPASVPTRPMRRNDISRVFAQTAPVFDASTEASVEAVLELAIRIALKAWIELTRLGTFTKSQFQQLEVDVFTVRVSIIPTCIAGVRGVCDSLLDEILTSAIEMCSDPNPELAPGLIERAAVNET